MDDFIQLIQSLPQGVSVVFFLTVLFNLFLFVMLMFFIFSNLSRLDKILDELKAIREKRQS